MLNLLNRDAKGVLSYGKVSSNHTKIFYSISIYFIQKSYKVKLVSIMMYFWITETQILLEMLVGVFVPFLLDI